MMAAVTLAVFTAGSAFAQVNSGQITDVALNATLNESLTVTLDQPTIDFSLVAGSSTNAGSTAVNAGVSWILETGRTSVKLYAYFTSATSALNNGSNLIPSSAVSATLNGTGAGAFTGATPFGGNTGITVSTTAITTNLVSSTSTSVALNIDLSSLTTLPAGTYTGTLHFQAQATT